jgi:hypothetical protein
MRSFCFGDKIVKKGSENMNKKFLSAAAVFCLSLLIATSALAHQPRFVREMKNIEVNNPEISKAFYGELTGEPVVYEIKSPVSFDLYVGLLVPDLPGIGKNVSAEVVRLSETGEEKIMELDGQNYQWSYFFEEFAGDNYWQGPEGRKSDALPGYYLVTVYRPDNFGKYVLAVGEIESFPAEEVVNTITVLPQIKKDFFGKSPWSVFKSRIGIFFGGFVLLLLILTVFAIITIRIVRRRKTISY